MAKHALPLRGLDLDAVFNCGDGEGRRCKINGILPDGLEISFLDSVYSRDLGSRSKDNQMRCSVTFRLDARYLIFDSVIVDCTAETIQLRYQQPNSAMVDLLVQAAQSNGEKGTPENRRIQNATVLSVNERANLIRFTNTRNRTFLEERLPEFFKTLEDELFSEAEMQGSNTGQQRYFEALAAFKKNSARIAVQLEGTLSADASDVASGRWKEKHQDAAQNDSESGLTLIEKDDFEDWLIVRVATSRTELQYRDVLIELQLRLDAAFADGSATGAGNAQANTAGSPTANAARVYNPYGPAAFCNAFYACIRPLRMSQKIERLVFKVFHERILSDLGTLYKNINSILIEAGILPDINVTKYLSQQALKNRPPVKPAPVVAAASSTSETTPAAKVEAGKSGEGATVSANGAFRQLQDGLERAKTAYSTATRLWQLHSTKDSAQGGSVRESDAPMSQEVVQEYHQAIATVKNRLLSGAVNLDTPGSLKHHIALASGPGSVIKEQDFESANLIENLFSHILEDTRVETSLHSDLRKLEVPMLEVMLTDPTLFTADFHPARQAVNFITLLSDKGSINLTQNKPVIRQCIQELVKIGNSDPATFNQVVNQLDALVDKERVLIERNLSKVTEACSGQEKVKTANQLIERELEKRLGTASVPEVLLQLVSSGWRELMRLCYFREGIDSRAWEMTLIVIDQLLLRLMPDQYDESKLLFKPEELTKLIEKGLSKIGTANAAQEEMLSTIGKLLKFGITEDTPFSHYQRLTSEQESQAQKLKRLGAGADDKSVQRWIKRTKNLKEGQWLEFDATGEKPILHQLAWISNQFDRYVFVNHQGMKVKDISLEELALKLKSGDIIVLSDSGMTAVDKGLDALIRKIYDQLAFESTHDQLTGLSTRKEFERCIAQAVGRAKRNQSTYALIFIDILQFKVINNTCGYEAGDNFLRDIAKRIASVAYENAMIGRLGGNEFGVLIPVESEKKGYLAASEVKAAIEERRFESGSQSFVISAVISMITFNQENNHVLELLRSVEATAEIGKKTGQKEIQVVKPGDARMEERDEVMSWVARINRALDQGNLKIRCQLIQPILTSDQLPHFEVLLTVVDENGEHLPPADFIKAAEEYHRMAAVDRWVINTVLVWMKDHEDLLAKMDGFSINLSGHSLNDETFLDFLFETMVRFEVPRQKLIFEITETTAVANLEDAADFINEMKGIGCRFSLDDFGAGQSSYTYLKRLPVDYIKIDGAFIKNIAQDDVDFAMVKSITEMGHFLGKKIIAEFVSSAEILEVVKGIGIDYAQGFHLGKPVMLENIDGSLQQDHQVA